MERHFTDAVTRISADMGRLSGESRELMSFATKHFFNKVPSMSALSGILAGALVSSAFATSPVKSMMALFGIVNTDAGAKVASPVAHSLLSVFLPLFSAAATIYVAQKTLKSYRKKRLERYIEASSLLEKEKLSELASKRALLEEAKNKGLLTDGEYETKLAGLYQPHSGKLPSGFQEFIVKKLTS
ncbi:MAG: hypothetical protein IT362_02685 [Deltaproteobacteria bacterium]|nr:hypothetical protein [Deltaproteobacteria bacterium]